MSRLIAAYGFILGIVGAGGAALLVGVSPDLVMIGFAISAIAGAAALTRKARP